MDDGVDIGAALAGGSARASYRQPTFGLPPLCCPHVAAQELCDRVPSLENVAGSCQEAQALIDRIIIRIITRCVVCRILSDSQPISCKKSPPPQVWDGRLFSASAIWQSLVLEFDRHGLAREKRRDGYSRRPERSARDAHAAAQSTCRAEDAGAQQHELLWGTL